MKEGNNTLTYVEVAIISIALIGKRNGCSLQHKKNNEKTNKHASWRNGKDVKGYNAIIAATGEWFENEAYAFFEDVVKRVAMRQGCEVGSKRSHFLGQIAASLSNSLGHALNDGNPTFRTSRHQPLPASASNCP